MFFGEAAAACLALAPAPPPLPLVFGPRLVLSSYLTPSPAPFPSCPPLEPPAP